MAGAKDAKGDSPPPQRLTPAERAKLKREEKLKDIEEQIASGELKVRKPTKKERADWEKRAAEREKKNAKNPGRRRR